MAPSHITPLGQPKEGDSPLVSELILFFTASVNASVGDTIAFQL